MTKRIGTIRTVDATLSFRRSTLVRELEDGTIEYHVGDSARRRDGWAELPPDLLSQVEWDSPGSV